MARRPRCSDELSPARQRYVERIDELCRRHGHAHISALAASLQVRMPSVTETVGRLAKSDIVVRTSGHEIVLTARGRRIAGQLNRRHETLRRFMTEVLAMKEDEADAASCRLEHCEDGEMFARLGKLAKFLRAQCPGALKEFGRRMKRGAAGR